MSSALQTLQIAPSSVARDVWCGSGVIVEGKTTWSGAEVAHAWPRSLRGAWLVYCTRVTCTSAQSTDFGVISLCEASSTFQCCLELMGAVMDHVTKSMAGLMWDWGAIIVGDPVCRCMPMQWV